MRHPRSLLLSVLALVLAACTTTPGASGVPTPGPSATAGPPATAQGTTSPTFPLTLVDDEDTEVAIPAEPRKIVSLTPDATETLFAIGAGDRVVGKVEDVASFPPDSTAIPDVATYAGVDVEQIVALGADLVISGGSGLTQGPAVEQLRRAGIPVLVSYPTTIDGALESIRRIGTAVGLPDEAAVLADQVDADLNDLSTLAGSVESSPRVFYEIDVTGGIFTPPADSIYGEMFSLANATLISGDASYSISLEDLVAADPEVILLGDGAYGVTAEQVAKRAGWGGMTAVKNGRIVAVDDIVITRPGPRLAEGLRALIRAIHPELVIP